jgi:hypothetical protein
MSLVVRHRFGRFKASSSALQSNKLVTRVGEISVFTSPRGESDQTALCRALIYLRATNAPFVSGIGVIWFGRIERR